MPDGQGPYRVMPRPEIALGSLAALAVGPEHIEQIRRWRNAQMSVLRQSKCISRDEQIAYFNSVIWPDKQSDRPSNILLMCLRDGDLIGYGGLVHISWSDLQAEISFLLDPVHRRDAQRYAAAFATWIDLMKSLAFEDLNLRKLTTETFATRTDHLEILDQSGFGRAGVLKGHVVIDGNRVDSILHGLEAE